MTENHLRTGQVISRRVEHKLYQQMSVEFVRECKFYSECNGKLVCLLIFK